MTIREHLVSGSGLTAYTGRRVESTWGSEHRQQPESMPATCRWTWGQPGPSGQTRKPSSLQTQELSSQCVQEDLWWCNHFGRLPAHSLHHWKLIMKRFFHCFFGLMLVLCTWQKPCHHGGEDGRLPLTDTSQKGVEQTITSHSKDNTWKWKHGAEETKPEMKEAGGRGGKHL